MACEQDTPMRALTVRPPWSEWIADGVKMVENRANLTTRWRGTLAIHAGKTIDRVGFHRATELGHPIQPDRVTRGAFLALAELVDVHPAGRDCGPDCNGWADPDCWHWVLWGARRITPVPTRGQLGLFYPPDGVRQHINSNGGAT